MGHTFKLNHQIYFMLALVLILALTIQTTRLNSMLNIGRSPNSLIPVASAPFISPLTDEQVELLDEDKLLLLYDPDEAESVQVMEHTAQMLQYMKKQYDAISILQYQGTGQFYEHMIITFSDLDRLPNNTWIEPYVEQGGRILFAIMPSVGNTIYRIYRKLGINELGGFVLSKGINFKSNVLIHYKNEKFSAKIVTNTSLQVQLANGSHLYAADLDGLPLLWETTYGRGSFIVFNGTMFQEKASRGLLTGAISLLRDDYIYPIFNSKIMYIDDFPAPIPSGYHEAIYQIYKRSSSEFIKEVWWPDMIRLASRHRLKYTGAVIQSYDDKTSAPFQLPSESGNLNLVTFGRELLKRGGEVGIHGYNHQSLSMDPAVSKLYGYQLWHSIESMEQSIRIVTEFVRNSLPHYEVHNYVPPSNVLSAQGREALKRGWPELKSISSLYNEDADKVSYVQEFEIAKDGIVEMPRITSGYSDDPYTEWLMANTVSSLGVFSHFIHPDDIFDEQRSLLNSWERLYDLLDDYLTIVNKKYDWLREQTATEASRDFERYAYSEPHFDYQADRIEGFINHYIEGKLYYLLRTSRKITSEKNCRLTRVDDEVYLVEVEQAHFVIGLGE